MCPFLMNFIQLVYNLYTPYFRIFETFAPAPVHIVSVYCSPTPLTLCLSLCFADLIDSNTIVALNLTVLLHFSMSAPDRIRRKLAPIKNYEHKDMSIPSIGSNVNE